MKHPLDSFVDFLERTTPLGVCILCGGTGKVLYAGRFVKCFEDVCHLCNGTGKSENAPTNSTQKNSSALRTHLTKPKKVKFDQKQRD